MPTADTDERPVVTFEEFARAELPSLTRFAAALCGDRGVAEDVLQEVLLRAHSRWDTIGSADSPAAYVRRMVVNEFLSWRRKWARIVPRAEIPSVPQSDPTVRTVDRLTLEPQIARLPRRQQAVLALRFYGGMTDSEIAGHLGCSAGTVRGYLSRALATLRVDLAATNPTLSPEY